METHNRAPRGSEGLSCRKRTVEIAWSFLFSNRNNAVIKCVCHHVLVTQVKLHCMEVLEVTVVFSSSHLLRQRTQKKQAGMATREQRFPHKASGKSKCHAHHTSPYMCHISKRMDIHTGRHPVVPKGTETHRFRTIRIKPLRMRHACS